MSWAGWLGAWVGISIATGPILGRLLRRRRLELEACQPGRPRMVE